MSAASTHASPPGTAPYYFIPAPSRHPVLVAFGLFLVILGAGQWINGADWGKYSLLAGVVVWLTFGLSIGIISAVKHRTVLDRLAIGLSLVAISAPVYWLGLVSLYLFAPDFGVFGLSFVGGQAAYTPFSDSPSQTQATSAPATGSSIATIPAVVAEMWRNALTSRKNGTIVPQTIIQAASAQIGRCSDEM